MQGGEQEKKGGVVKTVFEQEPGIEPKEHQKEKSYTLIEDLLNDGVKEQKGQKMKDDNKAHRGPWRIPKH